MGICIFWQEENVMNSQKVKGCHFLSFRRKPESRENKTFWTPAFAGVTALRAFTKPLHVEPRQGKLLTDDRIRFPILQTERQGEQENHFFG